MLGGRRFEFIVADTKTDPKTAVERTNALIQGDEVGAVIGPVTSANRDAMQPTIERFRTPLLYAIVLVVYLMLLVIERSPFGTVLRTIRGNEYRTGFFGYDVAEYKTVAFTVSGAVAGLAGALFTAQFGFVSPALIGFALSTEVLIWTAVGGRGALLVRSVEGVLSENLGNYWLLILGLLFVVTVVVAPRGLFGVVLSLPLPRRLTRRTAPGSVLEPGP